MQSMATINIQEYKIGFTDQFFFDTNVWLLLYGTLAGFQAKEQKLYTNFFQDLLQKDTPIFLTAMVCCFLGCRLLSKRIGGELR
jgi:hypothetical protein